MKSIAISLLLLLAAVIGTLADGNGLDRRVSIVSLPKWSYQHLFTFLGSRAGYSVTISSNALDNAVTRRHGEIGFGGAFDNMSVREALSWSLYFAGASASITNSTLSICSGKSAPSLPKELQLAAESQRELKPTPSTVSLKEDEWDLYQLLQFLSHKADFDNVVIGPSITTNSISIRVSFEETPIKEALETSLRRMGGTYRIHGSVIYFTLKQDSPTSPSTRTQ